MKDEFENLMNSNLQTKNSSKVEDKYVKKIIPLNRQQNKSLTQNHFASKMMKTHKKSLDFNIL